MGKQSSTELKQVERTLSLTVIFLTEMALMFCVLMFFHEIKRCNRSDFGSKNAPRLLYLITTIKCWNLCLSKFAFKSKF